MKLTDSQGTFIRLLQRSPDRGEGWRSVSQTLWKIVEGFGAPDLLEVDAANRRCRLTDKGLAVAEYLT